MSQCHTSNIITGPLPTVLVRNCCVWYLVYEQLTSIHSRGMIVTYSFFKAQDLATVYLGSYAAEWSANKRILTRAGAAIASKIFTLTGSYPQDQVMAPFGGGHRPYNAFDSHSALTGSPRNLPFLVTRSTSSALKWNNALKWNLSRNWNNAFKWKNPQWWAFPSWVTAPAGTLSVSYITWPGPLPSFLEFFPHNNIHPLLHNLLHHSTLHHSTIHHSTIHHSIIYYSTLQYNTTLHHTIL